ncbi:GcrA family cell cycle regulator [Methylobacterium gossipiicola]|uniref:GcrA cell cycle regulator n=1 Tax=Methylobacterium gossipiicola TaxID=582675 RepID=A0A1I2VSU0_9HYPH|nr:GcrA family cell cycle regulator [Methylobacterium gossipiicola]SFG92354.1 GcrA cell cycle regulator [Methylobacterium gossipiicola]
MTETVPSWSDERVDLLRRLWQEGLSASRIATQLGGVSRNAVIGKIHRLGLSGRGAKGVEAPAGDEVRKAARAVEAPAAVTETSPAATAIRETGTVVQLQPAQPPAPEAPVSAAEPEPLALTTSRRVTIMDLRESMCRWPLGDPTKPDFHYCGERAITGLPYCPCHAQIAYQPAAERKRDRRVGGFR